MSPTRVTPYLGGTGQINTAKINVHPTLQRVTIGADVLANSNLEVRGNSYANVAEGATTRFGNVFITNLSQVNPNADFQIAKSGNVTFNLFSTTANVRQDFQAGSAQFSFLLFGGSPANLRMVAGAGVSNVTAEVANFNFNNNVYVRGNLFVTGDTTVNNVIQTVEVANTQSANAYYLTKAATDISMSNGWTFSGSNVAHFAYTGKYMEIGSSNTILLHGNSVIGSGGEWGIGTRSLLANLTLLGAGNFFRLRRTGGNGDYGLTAGAGFTGDNVDLTWTPYATTGQGYLFKTTVNGSTIVNALGINRLGNVSIGGNMSPMANLSVNGNTYISSNLYVGTSITAANLALGGATIGSHALAVTGNATISGSVGIGTATDARYNLLVNKNITGAVSSYGIYSSGEVQSDATTSAAYFQTFATTAAATFTVGSLAHFYANQSTIGAGSTVTTQYGYLVSSSLTGATNNYGFYGGIAAGSGRYNLYMSGTASNYLAGSLGLGSTGLTGIRLRNSLTITGATTSYGYYGAGVIQSDVTTTAVYLRTTASTVASAFTLTSLIHFYAVQGTIGATSAVTTQYGFYAHSSLIGATTNYGFFGGIAAGTGRYNLYMSGTAQNYMAGSLGIGTTSSTARTLSLGKSITGATIAYGIVNNGTVQSDVTSSAMMYLSSPGTQATAFTLNSLTSYMADQGTIGAGSTVNNQYGFYCASSLTGATNNYGFFGGIAAGTGRYNLYMSGTADNYLAGSLGIGTSTIGTTIALPPTGTSSKIAKTFSPSHQAGNAGNVFIGLSDGGGFSGMYVTNDWGGTYSSQNVIFFTAQGGVSVSTERFKIDYNGVLLHNSSNVLLDGSSNIPVTRLNGGLSANSSSYWRGDGTWATPAGGGGGSPWTETTGILYGTNTSSNVSIGSSTDFKTKLYVSGNAFVSSLMHISDNVVIGSTTTSNNRLTISGPDTTIPQIAFRSSDGNWWGRLGQVVNGATIGAFLSSGGSWSISGSTFSATKDLTGTFPTAALFIGNQYNSASETNFRFLSKAAGSTTSDGTITERMIIDGSGNVGIGTSTAYTKFHVSATSGAPASSGILTTGITIAEGVGGPSLNIGNYNSGGIYYSWIQSAFVNNAGVVQPLVLQQIGGVTNIGTATSLTDSGLTIQGSGVLQAWNTGLTGTTRRVWGVALEQATVGDFQLRMSTAANTKPSVARLAIDASGRVGIGPTTMTSNLQVTGNAYISANIVSSANVVGQQLVATNGLILNANTLSANYTIASGYNAVTVGPFVIPDAMNVTVSSDSYWVVL